MSIRNLFCLILLITVFLVPLPGFAVNERGVMEISLRFGPVPTENSEEVSSLRASPALEENTRQPLAREQNKTHSIAVMGKRHVAGGIPRQRNPELSSQDLVVVALDGQGHEINRDVIADPRVIRGDIRESSGELTSKLFYNESVEFSIVVPDDPDVSELRIYHPHWTGSEFILELIAQTKMP